MRTITIINQKGGSGKTTTAVCLGAALAEAGKRVAVVDLDPQRSASLWLNQPDPENEVADVLLKKRTLSQVLQPTNQKLLQIAPGGAQMNTVERQLDPGLGHLLRLRTALAEITSSLDFVLLDCPPGLRDLSKVGLLCGDELLVPVEASFMALQGLAELSELADQAKDLNPKLRWCGVFLTRFTDRTIMSTQALAQLQMVFADRLLPVRVPEGTRFKEAPGHREPITMYDPDGAGAAAYRDLAKVIISQQETARG